MDTISRDKLTPSTPLPARCVNCGARFYVLFSDREYTCPRCGFRRAYKLIISSKGIRSVGREILANPNPQMISTSPEKKAERARLRLERLQVREERKKLAEAAKRERQQEKEEKMNQAAFEKKFLADGERAYLKRCKQREALVDKMLRETFN